MVERDFYLGRPVGNLYSRRGWDGERRTWTGRRQWYVRVYVYSLIHMYTITPVHTYSYVLTTPYTQTQTFTHIHTCTQSYTHLNTLTQTYTATCTLTPTQTQIRVTLAYIHSHSPTLTDPYTRDFRSYRVVTGGNREVGNLRHTPYDRKDVSPGLA